MQNPEPRRWTVADAAELYEIAAWGKGYFSANAAGHMCVHPNKDPQQSIDLKLLVDQLKARGIELPVLIRFGDILKHRLAEIQAAFAQAIREHGYGLPTSAFTRSKSINSGRWWKRFSASADPIISAWRREASRNFWR